MDQISKFTTDIRNAVFAKRTFVDLPGIKMNEALLKVLSAHGFIAGYKKIIPEITRGKASFPIFRAHFNILDMGGQMRHVMRDIEQVSTPSFRRYKKAKEIFRVQNGLGISVFSTSSGFMTGSEAREKNIGGLCVLKVYS